MYRFLCSVSIAIVIALTQAGTTSAATHHRAHAQTTEVVVSFRLHAADVPPEGTTFWVAYGPIGGRFGLVSLRPVGNQFYQAQRSLPSTGRTTFAFLAGHSAVSTPFGSAPGDPVQTIERIGPVTADHFHPATPQWHAPMG